MGACPLMLRHDGISMGWKFVGSRPRGCSRRVARRRARSRGGLGVSRQSVMRWYRAWRAGGREALRAAGRAGRKPRLAPGAVGPR
ncbi:MAG: helix-turn-helix domain-containing protein [Candidatus Rokuibacteriota bacterium]